MNQQLRKLRLRTSFWSQFFLLLFCFFLTSEALVLKFFRRSNYCPAKTLAISEQMSGVVRVVVMLSVRSYQKAILSPVLP